MKRSLQFLGAAAAALFAGTASAHPLLIVGAGFAQGFAHPFSGIDHLLAMIAVGLWAAQLGGRALWAVPASFVGMMAIGAVAGVSGLALPMGEIGIAGSVLVLGALVATGARLPTVIGMALVGTFAFFHGHAHGSELPLAANAWSYGGGFILATAILHGIGMLSSLVVRNSLAARLVRFSGVAIAATGLVLLGTV